MQLRTQEPEGCLTGHGYVALELATWFTGVRVFGGGGVRVSR